MERGPGSERIFGSKGPQRTLERKKAWVGGLPGKETDPSSPMAHFRGGYWGTA